MFGNTRIAPGIIAVVVIWLLGCTPGIAGSPPAIKSRVLQTLTTADPVTGQCQVTVVVSRPGFAVDLDVRVQAERGILFNATNDVYSDVQRVSMLAEDERLLFFPCRLDTGAVQLSGAYVVRAITVYAGSSQLHQAADNHLYVLHTAGQTPQLLASREMFDRYFTTGYVQGGAGLAYQMALDPVTGQGLLHVRVPGGESVEGPVLRVQAADGLQFVSDSATVITVTSHSVLAQLPSIATSGVRIVTIPFFLEPDAGPGRYSVEVTADYHSHQVAEVAPHSIRVVTDQMTGRAGAIGIEVGPAVAISPSPSFSTESVQESVPPAPNMGPGEQRASASQFAGTPEERETVEGVR